MPQFFPTNFSLCHQYLNTRIPVKSHMIENRNKIYAIFKVNVYFYFFFKLISIKYSPKVVILTNPFQLLIRLFKIVRTHILNLNRKLSTKTNNIVFLGTLAEINIYIHNIHGVKFLECQSRF